MSDDCRMVCMSAEQARILEDVGVEMMRQADDRAMRLLSLSLAFKFAKAPEPTLPDNVVEFEAYSRRVGA